ncbi:hypothetical protein [Streptomyces hiroshimensis]|uniref:hypothetical protein n=1 Tax=Streptomyces hiroshimensis TaxID=66424 RepID=UPI0016729AC4|nr:hypothetical protein [Streptomyces hiroshimensis]
MVLVSPGCGAAGEGGDWLCSLGLDWSSRTEDGFREAVLGFEGREVGTLVVHPAPVAARLWWHVRRAGCAALPGAGPVAEPRRHALLRLDEPPERRLSGTWCMELTPVWRTAEGTTMTVARLPVPCPRCTTSHGGGLCVLLPLSGGQPS